MSDWTAGYIADINYTYGYYSALNPLRKNLAFLYAGLACPEVGIACDLGFGQGVSVNIHAAASPIAWWGTDFNPAQAGFAQELADASGNGAQLFDQSFAEFCSRPDLPVFDYIGLHGIWSWISDENRTVLVDFVHRRLKPGGVLYISYNTHPGWSAFLPMRHLLSEYASVMDAPGVSIASRIDHALAFAEKFLETKPLYAQNNPQVAARFAAIQGEDRNYLAHEYFNRSWSPITFAEMAHWLAPAKLGYACSAQYHDHIEKLNLSDVQKEFLSGIPDPMFRESLRDLMVDQLFRRDYWVKGVRRLSSREQAEKLRRQRVILTFHRPGIVLKVNGPRGEGSLQEEIYDPILDALADHEPRTLGWIEQEVRELGIDFKQVMQAIMMLIGMGALHPAQEESVIAEARTRTDPLNAHLLAISPGMEELTYLASPVTGGGYHVSRFSLLFLLARAQGRKHPDEWAGFAWEILAEQDLKIIHEGKTLETNEENMAELARRARNFAEKQVPILQSLQII